MKRHHLDATNDGMKSKRSPERLEEKKHRMDVMKIATVHNEQKTLPNDDSDFTATDELTLDTKVPCFICGRKGPLRRLTAHQMKAHSELQFVPPKPKAVCCMFCNYAMPSESLERHLKRKHPIEYSKIQDQKTRHGLAGPNQLTKSMANLVEQMPKSRDESKDEHVPKIPDLVPKKEVKLEPEPVSQPTPTHIPTIVFEKRSLLSVEEDDDGFFDLVLTELIE